MLLPVYIYFVITVPFLPPPPLVVVMPAVPLVNAVVVEVVGPEATASRRAFTVPK